MLLRICLIIALLGAGAAVGLNMFMVKPKIITLHGNWKKEEAEHQKSESAYRLTKSHLDKTNAILKQTIATLEATTAEKEKALSDLAAQTKRADKLTDDLTKARQERDDAQSSLAAYEAT